MELIVKQILCIKMVKYLVKHFHCIRQTTHIMRRSPLTFRHHASYIYIYIYIGQTYRYSPEYTFYIFSQQIYFIIFLDFLSPSSFIPPQNVVYFLMVLFLVHKIFTFYLNGVLNCKFSSSRTKGLRCKVKV